MSAIEGPPLRFAFVSGDGVPISGFMPVLRNVLEAGRERRDIGLPIPADFGYAWRSDMRAFFGEGDVRVPNPAWLVCDASPSLGGEPESVARRLDWIRRLVANPPQIGSARERLLAREIGELADRFYVHFSGWFERHPVDWVFAVNMTLSDAVPARIGLERAARSKHIGLLLWDHDLFGSCNVVRHSSERVYPPFPNEWTPLPAERPDTRWVVSTKQLYDEALSYPTDCTPVLAPEILPTMPSAVDVQPLETFCRYHRIQRGHPVILNPVRMIPEKGALIAVRLMRQLLDEWPNDRPTPCLLLFGRLAEDPEYASVIMSAVRLAGIEKYVRFLDGVPVECCYTHGEPRLSERELLALARRTRGGVMFTPSVPDVETIGLGPALAAVAELPVLISPYNAFEKVYGANFCAAIVSAGDTATGVREFRDMLVYPGRYEVRLSRNCNTVVSLFDPSPWQELFSGLPAFRV